MNRNDVMLRLQDQWDVEKQRLVSFYGELVAERVARIHSNLDADLLCETKCKLCKIRRAMIEMEYKARA